MRVVLCFLVAGLFSAATAAQSTAFVFKGGLSAGTQKWDNSSRELLFKYHGAISMESVNNEDDRSSLLLQLGYHSRGSATRFQYIGFNGFPNSVATEEIRFNNLSLIVAAKQKKALGSGNSRLFYSAGIRGDYTLNTNVDELSANQPCNVGFYPFIGGVQRWMVGVSLGGGLELDLAELFGLQFELSVHPDLTNQYRQPSATIINQCAGSFPGSPSTINIPERRIRNTTVELSVGLRLLRKVEYVE